MSDTKKQKKHGQHKTRHIQSWKNTKVPHVQGPSRTIHPGHDFYKYVNGVWQRHVHMPSYMSSYGVSDEIEYIIQKELQTIIADCRQRYLHNPDKHLPYFVKNIGLMAQSALHVPSQANSIKLLRRLISQVYCLRSSEEVAHMLGGLIQKKVKMHTLVFISPSQDTGINHICLTYGDNGLPDPSYYTLQTPQNNQILEQYNTLLTKLGNMLDVEKLSSLIGMETMAAKVYEKIKGTYSNETLYSGLELHRKYKYIPWDSFFQGLMNWEEGTYKDKKFLMLSEYWYSFLNKCFRTFSLDSWKLWTIGNIINYALPILPPPYDDMHFFLFGKKLRDQTEKIPQYQLTLRLIQDWLPQSLGRLYVEKYVHPKLKSEVTHLSEEIINATVEHIGTTEWLLPSTRKIAQKKVKNMFLGIAHPHEFDDNSKDCILDPKNLLYNVLEIGKCSFLYECKDVGKPVDIVRWDDQVFVVNAYYYNEGNRLILPSGILRWPFFDVKASLGWNYGGIGCTLGHEITHAFDIDGRTYDEHGLYGVWWKTQDNRKYNEKTKTLINLYNKTSYLNKFVNGNLTLSENIADLGGMAFALGALKKRMYEEKLDAHQQKKMYQDFFISYANSWRTKEKHAKALQSLFMDAHAPPSVRVNNIVCQFDEWYECFDIQPNNALYKAPEERIRIF